VKLYELQSPLGANKGTKRVGRGAGSGMGKTSCRGQKGQKARAGGNIRPGFEGGQMPLYRRLPKRGFNNKTFAKFYTVVNIGDLNIFDDNTVVTTELLRENGLVKKIITGVAILGNGEITKKLTIRASKFSKAAQAKIEAVGGKVEVV